VINLIFTTTTTSTAVALAAGNMLLPADYLILHVLMTIVFLQTNNRILCTSDSPAT